MTSVADLLQDPPATDRGVPVGIGDWRLVVEAMVPLDGSSLWGVATWGESKWSNPEWQDITDDVRGIEWSRGSDEPYGRARVGSLELTLDSQADQWSPWNESPPLGGVAAAYFGPGTIVRVGLRSATDTRRDGWLPQITAIVDRWGQTNVDANGADRFVTVEAFETVRDLAGIDDNAEPSATGAGEVPAARLTRLLDAAAWKYGLQIQAGNILTSPTAYPLIATDMSDNRLSECYRVADSCDVTFMSSKTGAALVQTTEYAGGADLLDLVAFSVAADGGGIVDFRPDATFVAGSAPGRVSVIYDGDTFRSSNTDDAIVNVARFANVGGSQQVKRESASVTRFGERTLVRSDLMSQSDASTLQFAEFTVSRRALNTLRVENIDVHVCDLGNDQAALAVAAMDYYSRVNVHPPPPAGGHDGSPPYILGYLSGMTHRITPRNAAGVTWQASLRFDTRLVYNLTAAQLPSDH